MKLLDFLKKQRECFERLANGDKRIFNPFMYYAIDLELFREQKRIGRENKKSMRKIHGNNWGSNKYIKKISEELLLLPQNMDGR